MPKIELLNMDCMEYMAGLPDKAFDLAIVDPPFGIGENWKKDRYSKFYNHSSSYKNKAVPKRKFFKELFRVSKNQIIWGANYYTRFLPVRQGWIVWDKNRKFTDSHMAELELAWHSFNIPARVIKRTWNGFMTCEPRYGKHPHEKPVSLYTWLLKEYATAGDRILDTHSGSGSSAIAAHRLGFDLTGCELDQQYFDDSQKRFKEAIKQQSLFPSNGQKE